MFHGNIVTYSMYYWYRIIVSCIIWILNVEICSLFLDDTSLSRLDGVGSHVFRDALRANRVHRPLVAHLPL
jgi:hypothetical protein